MAYTWPLRVASSAYSVGNMKLSGVIGGVDDVEGRRRSDRNGDDSIRSRLELRDASVREKTARLLCNGATSYCLEMPSAFPLPLMAPLTASATMFFSLALLRPVLTARLV